MNIWRLILFLSLGTIVMLVPITIQGIWYQVRNSKCLLIAVILTITGTLGTFLLFFVENGSFGGTSFFGAVFFVPIIFILVAPILKIKYSIVLDMCAPAECAMLSIMKVQCYLTGCCGGIRITLPKFEFIFPSQITELITAIILCIILLMMSGKAQYKGKMYPVYMVFYGVLRFALNMFRKTGFVSVLRMPFGNFWSLISIIIGIVWLFVIYGKDRKIQNEHSQN